MRMFYGKQQSIYIMAYFGNFELFFIFKFVYFTKKIQISLYLFWTRMEMYDAAHYTFLVLNTKNFSLKN